jgi:hypothetical protein
MVVHRDLSNAELHEPKNIGTAVASDAGKVITPSAVDGVSELRQIDLDEITTTSKRSGNTGWAIYASTAYTSGAKLSIAATTRTKITLNSSGGASTNAYVADGDSDYYNISTGKIMPTAAGDAYDVRLIFSCDVAGSGVAYVDADLDIGGAIGIVAQETKVVSKGSSVENKILLSWPIFCLSTFVSNGGEIYLTPDTNMDFWDFSILITKTHQHG